MIDNRTRESRLSGMGRGLCGNVVYGGTRIPLYVSKGCRSDTLHLRMRAPQFYPDVAAEKAVVQRVKVPPC